MKWEFNIIQLWVKPLGTSAGKVYIAFEILESLRESLLYFSVTRERERRLKREFLIRTHWRRRRRCRRRLLYSYLFLCFIISLKREIKLCVEEQSYSATTGSPASLFIINSLSYSSTARPPDCTLEKRNREPATYCTVCERLFLARPPFLARCCRLFSALITFSCIMIPFHQTPPFPSSLPPSHPRCPLF